MQAEARRSPRWVAAEAVRCSWNRGDPEAGPLGAEVLEMVFKGVRDVIAGSGGGPGSLAENLGG